MVKFFLSPSPLLVTLLNLSLSYILSYLLRIILIMRNGFLIPDISHFGALLRRSYHSQLDVSLKCSAFLWAAFSFLFFFFASFSLFSRWNFHWLKPDVACTFVFTWPSPAQEDESLAVLFYQFTRFPHPSLSSGCWLQNEMSPWLIVCRFRRQSGGELFCFCCQV